MANVYQVHIVDMQPTASGEVHADTVIQMRTGTNPNFVWVDTSQGHRTIVLYPPEVFGITNASMTNPQKRQALRDLIKEKARAFGIDEADQAYLDFIALVPPPFDVTIRGA